MESKVITELTSSNITEITREYLCRSEPLKLAKKYLSNNISEKLILNYISDDLALKIYNDFSKKLEEKIEEIIEKEFNQVKVPVGTKVRMLYKEFKEPISTIKEITRFDEDTWGYGWYGYTLVSGDFVYRKEFEVIE